MNSRRQQELIDQLASIAEEMGWDIAIPGSPENPQADGVFLGTSEFLDVVFGALDQAGVINLDDNEIFSLDDSTGELKEVEIKTKSKRSTYH